MKHKYSRNFLFALLAFGIAFFLYPVIFEIYQKNVNQPFNQNVQVRNNLEKAFQNIPLYFEPNVAETGSEASFLTRGSGYEMTLFGDKAVLSLAKKINDEKDTNLNSDYEVSTLTMSLADSNKNPLFAGEEAMAGKVNYLVGNDQNKWLTNIPTYRKVRYRNVYSGVDLLYYGNQTELEFDFIVSPGADAQRIEMDFAGAKKIEKKSDGEIILSLDGGDVILQKPVLYQTDADGRRQTVAGEFALADEDSVKFKIGEYDRDRELIIDPILSYSTFLPGANIGYDIAVDNDGNAYVTGNSFGGVPTTTGAATGGVFVTKFNPQGSNLIFSTRVGGSSSSETGRAIKLDPDGNIVVAGSTHSRDFPVVNPVKGKSVFYISANAGESWSNNSNLEDYQIFQIAPSHQDANLLYSAAANRIYRSADGGNSWTNITNNLSLNYTSGSIAVNPMNSAQVYVAAQNGLNRSNDGGNTWSLVSGALLPANGISMIVFDPRNTDTIYLAVSGGVRKTIDRGATWTNFSAGFPANTNVTTLAVDSQNSSVLYAGTGANGVYKSINGGSWTAINTGISGNNSNIIREMAIDPNNPSTVYVATGNYAGVNYIFKTVNGGDNWSLIYTSPASGSNEIGAIAVSRTNSSRLYIGLLRGGFFRSNDGGVTWSRAQNGMWSSSVASIVESPLVADKIYVGAGQDFASEEAFVFKLNPSGTSFVFSSTLGGSERDDGYALAVDAQGSAYVGGTTKSFNFPTVNAVQTKHASEGTDYLAEDGFVAKIAPAGGVINYSTYLGGYGFDYVNAVAVDGGNLIVAGRTQSANFPIFNALQSTIRGNDAFLTKFSASGNSLIFSTLWGGAGYDGANGVEIDADSNILLVGATESFDLPAVNALQVANKGSGDGFVSKFSPNGSQILFSTYFGGRDEDRIQDVDLDAGGNIYVTGASRSPDFPQVRSVKSRSPYFRSSDGAAKWSNFNNDIFSNIYDFAFHPTNPSVMFAVTGDSVIKTVDGGDTWSKIASVPAAQSYNSIEFNPQNPNTIYLGFRETTGNYNGRIAVSTDGGASWSVFSQLSAGSEPIFKIIVSPVNPQIIYAANYFGAYKTVDGGATWAKVTPALWLVSDLAVNQANPSTIFITQGHSGGGVYRSLDGGATWLKMSNGISGEYGVFVITDPRQPSTVYARTHGGIFKSTDNGDSWALLQNLPPGYYLTVDPFSSDTLYLVTHLTASAPSTGVYRSVDGGNTWTLFNSGMPVGSSFDRFELDPRIKGTIHGVVRLSASNNDDIFISKINPAGTNLLYSSVLGGDVHTGNAFQDVAFGVAVHPSGSAFVSGGTTTTDFPTTPGAYYRTHNNTTLFVARFDASWTVKGRITDRQTGDAIQGAGLTLNGGRVLTTESDGLGKYVFPNVAENDSFNLVPQKLGYDFTPPNYSIASLNRDEVLDFTGVYVTHTISGKITFQQNPLPNVAVNLSGSQTGATVTDAGGNFSFTVPKHGNYSVRPALNGYIFAPQQLTFSAVTSDLRADFAARAGYAIRGQITRNGNPVVGATVDLTGSESQTATTDSEGRYSFDAGANGNYQVKPDLSGLAFLPESRVFSNLGSNQTGDFTAVRLPSAISNITFVSENSFAESQSEIFNIDDEGLNLQRVTTTSFSEGQPAWSPNGRKIAYISSSTGNPLLSVMDYDGKNSRTIVSSVLASGPDWSPDGGKIVFGGYDAGLGMNIFVVNADGSGLKRLTNDSVEDDHPNWSPDASKIAFMRGGKIFTVKPDGTDLQRVTNSNLSENEPDWSPDGNELVFTGLASSEPRVYLVRADGTNLRRLTGEDVREINPSWSLDGKRIAYLREGNSGNIYTINVDGTERRQITNTTLRKSSPVWKPRLSRLPAADFDGDGKTDLSIYRPTVGEWWYLKSSSGDNGAFQFGANTDKIVPADFTGDGKTDFAFFRPQTGEWFVLRSEDNSFYSFPFGANGDIPAPADFDGDGKTDAAVFRPSNTTWYISRSLGGTTIQQFGASGDVPAVADYDGDGKSDIAIYRPSLGQWWLSRSAAGAIAFQFGANTDKPVQGDYTGDGKADVAFFRPSTGEWFILRSENNSFYAFPFGTDGDIPSPGDYDGDGKTDAAVFRPSNNTWFVQRSTAGTLIQTFGQTGDLSVPNAFVP